MGMVNMLIAFVFVALSVSYALMAWFRTEFPMLVYEVLRKLGYRKGSALWQMLPAYDSDDYTRSMWEIAVAIHEPKLLASLLGCRYCLSFHLAFWFSLLVQLILLCVDVHLHILFVPFCVGTVPCIANLIYSKSHDGE